MALIVNFAHASTWKIRAATSARLAMWRHRPMWGADNDPKPVNMWPTTASLKVLADSRVSQVDPVWNQPAIKQAWIEGPVFFAGNGYLGVRDNRVNEMSEGVSKGSARVTLKYPFLPSMGVMSMPAEHALIDSVWQFFTMNYARNSDRRAKGWWKLEDAPEWAGLRQVFLLADQRLTSNPNRELMRPLDRDLDLYSRGYGFDFYAHYSPVCEDDVDLVRMVSIINDGGLLDRIEGNKRLRLPGVCERMANSYLRMYQDELAILLLQPNPPQPQIALLRQWIRELTDFIAQLQ